MSYLLSVGETDVKGLIENVLGLSAFSSIPQGDYLLLLDHMMNINHLEQMEGGGLIIGRAGERVVNDYNF